jgi:hypothetical protein
VGLSTIKISAVDDEAEIGDVRRGPESEQRPGAAVPFGVDTVRLYPAGPVRGLSDMGSFRQRAVWGDWRHEVLRSIGHRSGAAAVLAIGHAASLPERANAVPADLSSSQRQRLSLAAALARPSWLLLD